MLLVMLLPHTSTLQPCFTTKEVGACLVLVFHGRGCEGFKVQGGCCCWRRPSCCAQDTMHTATHYHGHLDRLTRCKPLLPMVHCVNPEKVHGGTPRLRMQTSACAWATCAWATKCTAAAPVAVMAVRASQTSLAGNGKPPAGAVLRACSAATQACVVSVRRPYVCKEGVGEGGRDASLRLVYEEDVAAAHAASPVGNPGHHQLRGEFEFIRACLVHRQVPLVGLVDLVKAGARRVDAARVSALAIVLLRVLAIPGARGPCRRGRGR